MLCVKLSQRELGWKVISRFSARSVCDSFNEICRELICVTIGIEDIVDKRRLLKAKGRKVRVDST